METGGGRSTIGVCGGGGGEDGVAESIEKEIQRGSQPLCMVIWLLLIVLEKRKVNNSQGCQGL